MIRIINLIHQHFFVYFIFGLIRWTKTCLFNQRDMYVSYLILMIINRFDFFFCSFILLYTNENWDTIEEYWLVTDVVSFIREKSIFFSFSFHIFLLWYPLIDLMARFLWRALLVLLFLISRVFSFSSRKNLSPVINNIDRRGSFTVTLSFIIV